MAVARWNTLRWPLGASVLAAMAITGCGAAGDKPEHRLHAAAEKSLLTLVARARTDVFDDNGAAAHTVLSEFVSELSTLRSSGRLSAGTAGHLERQARATAAQIKLQLPASSADHVTTHPTDPTTTPQPATSSSGAAAMPPIAIPVRHDPGARVPADPGQRHDQPLGPGNHRFPHWPRGDRRARGDPGDSIGGRDD